MSIRSGIKAARLGASVLALTIAAPWGAPVRAATLGPTSFGVNCQPGSWQCGNPAAAVAMAQAIHASFYRARGSVPHLLYPCGTFGGCTPTYVTANIDPIAQDNAPDTTSCTGITSYPVKVADISAFHVGSPFTADFIPPTAAICAVGATSAGGANFLSIDTRPSQYVNATSFTGLIGVGGFITLLTAASPPVPFELTVFNPTYQGKPADGPVLDQYGAPCTSDFCDLMYSTRLNYMVTSLPAPPLWIAQGNETDGGVSASCGGGLSSKIATTADITTLQTACTASSHVTISMNGDWGDLGNSTLVGQIQKIHDACSVAHLLNLKCSDGGVEIIGTQYAYADWEWNVCNVPSQLACRRGADVNNQFGFIKSVGQDVSSQKLATVCDVNAGTYTPPYLNTAHKAHADRALALITEAGLIGPTHPDYWNGHYYGLAPEGVAGMYAWVKSQINGKPIVFDETSVYGKSAVDVHRQIKFIQALGALYAAWWNQSDSSGTDSSATSLTGQFNGSDPAAVPIQPITGVAWNLEMTGAAPNVLNGFPIPLAPC